MEKKDTKPSKDVIRSYWDSECVQGRKEALSSQGILPLGDVRAIRMSAYTGYSPLQLWCSNLSTNICNWPPDRRAATCNTRNLDLGLAHGFIRNISSSGSNVLRTPAVECSNALVLAYTERHDQHLHNQGLFHRPLWQRAAQSSDTAGRQQAAIFSHIWTNMVSHLSWHPSSHTGPLLC